MLRTIFFLSCCIHFFSYYHNYYNYYYCCYYNLLRACIDASRFLSRKTTRFPIIRYVSPMPFLPPFVRIFSNLICNSSKKLRCRGEKKKSYNKNEYIIMHT
jgi:hypothetical protein